MDAGTLLIPGSILAIAASLRLASSEARGRRAVLPRILDVLVLGLRRRLDVVRVLERSAEGLPRRHRRIHEALASELDGGASLAEAMGGLVEGLGRRQLAMILAAEGSRHLPDVLESLAAEQVWHTDWSRRLSSLLLLPLATVLFLVSMQGANAWFAPTMVGGRTFSSMSTWQLATLALLGSVFMAHRLHQDVPLVRQAVRHLRARVPSPARGGVAALGDFFDSVAFAVQAGAALHAAVERALPVLAGTRFERGALATAASLAAGCGPADAWQRLGLPESVRVSATAASSGPDVVPGLRRIAAECRRRHATSRERLLATLHPACLLVVGVLVGAEFARLMGFLHGHLDQVVLPW